MQTWRLSTYFILYFADDMIIFANVKKRFIQRLLKCLDHYKDISS